MSGIQDPYMSVVIIVLMALVSLFSLVGGVLAINADDPAEQRQAGAVAVFAGAIGIFVTLLMAAYSTSGG